MHVDVTPPTGALWNVVPGADVIAAAAIHDGHQLRAEVNSLVVLTEAERLREEDPFTAGWTTIVGDKLMEINVFSPGGLGSAQTFEKVNFCTPVLDALERKVRYMEFYQRNFNNEEMAVL